MKFQHVKDGQGAVVPIATIEQAQEQIRHGSLTYEALIQYCFERSQLESRLNAFITLTQQQALDVAATLDAEWKSCTSRGALHGIPLVIKDNIDTAGIKTTVGSKLFCDRVPQTNATVVQRLQASGAVVLGKTNMTEFASSVSGHNPFYGDTCNPWNISHSAGGSSGGTACAVASGMCLGGIGTDTGGSIRVPASWCGIVGIRPTPGLVSLTGVYPRSSTMDVVGALASCVADVAIVLDVIAGYDPRDPNSTVSPFQGSYTDGLQRGVKGLRLGVIQNYTYRGVEPKVAQAIHRAINLFKKLQAEVVTINIPWLAENLDGSAYFNIVLYEFHQVLGSHYHATQDKNIFSTIVQDNIKKGLKVSRETYEQAQIQRQLYIKKIKEVFKEVEVLLTPTVPMVAPLLTSNLKIFHQTRQFALPFSFMGVPSISVPCGFSSLGLPIGLQIVGNHFQEALILRIAAAFESATNFGARHPSR
jgi:aspartyl-tRNA(Asn)/glutamyl-tRNA(Gln) amidotransferase subunit A